VLMNSNLNTVDGLLSGLFYLMGMWFGEDQRANIIMTHFLKEIGLRLQI
jgi:hypothetical protein